FGRSPPCHVRRSRKYLQSASGRACPTRVVVAEHYCPPLPSARQSASPTSLRHSARPTPKAGLPEHRRPETDRSSATHVLRVPPDPTAQGRQPRHIYS